MLFQFLWAQAGCQILYGKKTVFFKKYVLTALSEIKKKVKRKADQVKNLSLERDKIRDTQLFNHQGEINIRLF